MSCPGKALARPKRTEHNEAHERLKAGVEAELGRLHKTNALLICAQYTANYGDAEVDISDAIAAIIERVESHIETLDGLCLEVAHGRTQG